MATFNAEDFVISEPEFSSRYGGPATQLKVEHLNDIVVHKGC